jgi:hypothetical protein
MEACPISLFADKGRGENIEHPTPNIEVFPHRSLGRSKSDVQCSMFLLRLRRAVFQGMIQGMT